MSKKTSKRTKDCRKLSFIFWLFSTLCWVGVAIFAIVSAFSKVGVSEQGMEILSAAFKAKIISLSITIIIGLILSLLIKEKARVTVYMLALLCITIMYGEVAMYIVLAIWGIDEYVLYALYKRYKALILINKEIDRRE